MRKQKHKMKSLLRTFLAGIILISLTFIISCDNGGDEPEPGPTTLAGKYKYTKVTIITEVVIAEDSTGSDRTVVLPVGTDVTSMTLNGLVGSLQCNSVSNAAIDLREDHKLYAFCDSEGSTPVEGGTWSENSTLTELTINLAPPIVPVPVQLKQTNIQINGDNLSGDVANLPMSGILMASFPPPTITYPDNFKFPQLILMDVNIQYIKIK